MAYTDMFDDIISMIDGTFDDHEDINNEKSDEEFMKSSVGNVDKLVSSNNNIKLYYNNYNKTTTIIINVAGIPKENIQLSYNNNTGFLCIAAKNCIDAFEMNIKEEICFDLAYTYTFTADYFNGMLIIKSQKTPRNNVFKIEIK